MAAVGLILILLYIVVALVLRMLIQIRMTGSTGITGMADMQRAPLPDRFARVASVVALLLVVDSQIRVLVGGGETIGDRYGTLCVIVGLTLYTVGLVITFVAQLQMGASWRIGTNPDDHTDLVTRGLFASVRNPIYSAMGLAILGVVLTSPTVLGIVAVVLGLVVAEMQVRLVEEPHLRREHDDTYVRYAATTGRFVPGIGRLRSTD
jgi:protein-S-isoprenylcysteine O-methyltransferase Ste14